MIAQASVSIATVNILLLSPVVGFITPLQVVNDLIFNMAINGLPHQAATHEKETRSVLELRTGRGGRKYARPLQIFVFKTKTLT